MPNKLLFNLSSDIELNDEQINKLNGIKPKLKRIAFGDYAKVDSSSKTEYVKIFFDINEGVFYARTLFGNNTYERCDINFNNLNDCINFVKAYVTNTFPSQYFNEDDVIAAKFQPERTLYFWKSNEGKVHVATIYLYGEGVKSIEQRTGKKTVNDKLFRWTGSSKEVDINTDDVIFNAIQRACSKEVLSYDSIGKCSLGDLYSVVVDGYNESRIFVVKNNKAKSLQIKGLINVIKELCDKAEE